MIYQAFEAQTAMFDLVRPFASMMATTLRVPWPGLIPRLVRPLAAQLATFSTLKLTARRPAYRIVPVLVGNELVPVNEQVAATTPFATLLRFRKEYGPQQSRVLVVAPMSGHFATLLRSTIQTC